MFWKKTLLIVLLLILHHAAFGAGFDSVPCNGCSSQAMAEAAKSRLLQMPVGSSIYVHSMTTGEVNKYTIFAERDLIPGQIVYFAEPLPVEQWAIDFVADLHDAWLLSGGTMKFSFTASVQGELPTSAFEVVGSTSARNAISDHLGGSWPGALAGFASVGRLINPVNWFRSPDVKLTIVVHFPDGSKATFEYNFDFKSWEYVEDSAIDSNNNIIPETVLDFSGGDGNSREFNFSGGSSSDLTNFLQRAALLGIPITGPSSGRIIACVTAGGVTTCTVYSI